MTSRMAKSERFGEMITRCLLTMYKEWGTTFYVVFSQHYLCFRAKQVAASIWMYRKSGFCLNAIALGLRVRQKPADSLKCLVLIQRGWTFCYFHVMGEYGFTFVGVQLHMKQIFNGRRYVWWSLQKLQFGYGLTNCRTSQNEPLVFRSTLKL